MPLIKHLRQAAKSTGKEPELLQQEPYLSLAIKHVWEWYNEIGATRNTAMGLSALTYTEVLAWSTLLHTSPSPWEVGLIMRLDNELRQYRNEHAPKKGS